MKKENIKVAFFDVDDTLYNHEENCIPALHLEALKNLQDQGIKICLCSGRSLPMIDNLGLLDVFKWDGLVGGNGSFVYDQDFNLLYENTIPVETAKEIYRIGKSMNIPIFSSGNHILVDDLTDVAKDLLDAFHIKNVEVRDMTDDDHLSVMSLCNGDSKTRIPEFEQVEGVQVIYNKACIDIIKKDLSKYEGIVKYMEHHNFPIHDYIAFGDAPNDLEMLKHARYGVLMEDGDESIRDEVDYICPSCTKAGIYTFLKEHGWLV